MKKLPHAPGEDQRLVEHRQRREFVGTADLHRVGPQNPCGADERRDVLAVAGGVCRQR